MTINVILCCFINNWIQKKEGRKLSNQSEIKPLANKLFSGDWGKEPEPKLGNKQILGDRYTSKEFMALEWEK